jgi:hypothetical protein
VMKSSAADGLSGAVGSKQEQENLHLPSAPAPVFNKPFLAPLRNHN